MRYLKILLLVLPIFLLVHCAEKTKIPVPDKTSTSKEEDKEVNETPPPDNGREIEATESTDGARGYNEAVTVDLLEYQYHERFAEFIGSSINVESVKAEIQFKEETMNRFSGEVRIFYENQEQLFVLPSFRSGLEATDVRYNRWKIKDSWTPLKEKYTEWKDSGEDDRVFNFHAILEDKKWNGGALVVVIDEGVVEHIPINPGDGPDDGVRKIWKLQGSIWFKNFTTVTPTHSRGGAPRCLNPYWDGLRGDWVDDTSLECIIWTNLNRRKCWRIWKGAYDCRPWPVSTAGKSNSELLANSMVSDPALKPSGGYKKLGDFSGLPFLEVFEFLSD